MKNCLNCYNGFICKKREKAKNENPEEYEKLLNDGCPNWEDDSIDWDWESDE